MVKDNSSEFNVPQAALSPAPSSGPTMEEVYREHASRVLAAAYRVTGSNEDAEDVLQTVFSRLARGRALEQDRPWGAYLHRSAVNASIALGMLRADLAVPGTELEINIYGEMCKAVVQEDQPLWDPTNERLRA